MTELHTQYRTALNMGAAAAAAVGTPEWVEEDLQQWGNRVASLSADEEARLMPEPVEDEPADMYL
jgi:hypothetical protein